jgi:predicted TIM-barrel fold metal-dependent hydrolase
MTNNLKPLSEDPLPIDVVDSQIHLFRTMGLTNGLSAMDALGISSAVIDEYWLYKDGARDVFPGYRLPNGATRVIPLQAELASIKHPDRFSYVVRLDHRDPGMRSWMRIVSDSPNARAIRLIVRTEDELRAFANGEYRDCFVEASNAGLPIFLFIENGNIELSRLYLEEFSTVSVIADHLGMARKPGQFDNLIRLSNYGNLLVKWCHAEITFGARSFPFKETHAPLRIAIDSFGADRIMWASDFTVRQQEYSWIDRLTYLRDADFLTAQEKFWILGGTARKHLTWPAPKSGPDAATS